MRTDSTLPGILIYENDSNGLYTFCVSSGAPSVTATTASKFAVGCIIEDKSDGKTYQNVGTVASPSWNDMASISTSEIVDGAVTDAKLATANVGSVPRTATATVAGLTTGTLTPGTQYVSVTSADANHIVILPAPVVGTQVILNVGATGFELRSSTPTTIAINGGTGADAESAIAANSTVFMVCVSTTAWKGYFMDADGDLAKVEAAA